MSSLLEEAIVDAKALKDTALKNAENAVLERYSTEVRDALTTLLEQDELGLEPETPSADTSFTESVPFGFQNEEIGGSAEDELVEIDFDALRSRIAEEEDQGIEATPDEMLESEEVALELAEAADEGYIDITSTDAASLRDPVNQAAEEEDSKMSDEEIEQAAVEEGVDEDINLTEEMIADLIEELVVDMTPRPQGWASVNSADNSIEQANNDAMGAAQAAHLEEEEIEEDVATAPDVVSDAELYENKISDLKESTRDLHALLMESKNQLTQLNLDNAKLVYQNKALNSSSLNERQKNQIAEAVQSATSVEEAAMIFETIQNAVGISNSNNSSRPQTLREAVQRPMSLLINSKRNNEVTKDPKMDRMLRLAGLNK